MAIDFSDIENVFDRATRTWSWRKPNTGESPEEYREAVAHYVALSDPTEAEAILNGDVFTKYDPPVVFNASSKTAEKHDNDA